MHVRTQDSRAMSKRTFVPQPNFILPKDICDHIKMFYIYITVREKIDFEEFKEYVEFDRQVYLMCLNSNNLKMYRKIRNIYWTGVPSVMKIKYI